MNQANFPTRPTPWTLSVLLLALFVWSSHSMAHSRFILPSHTVLSTERAETISLMASISNDPFHPDMALGHADPQTMPPALGALFKQLESTVVLPDGAVAAGPEWQAFGRFSAADATLEQSGTYRLRLTQRQTPMTTYLDKEGTAAKAFGPAPTLPDGATRITRRMIAANVETYVSRQQATKAAVRPLGQGLELSGDTHPNDLFVNEPISFRLTFNGQSPGKPVALSLIRGNSRHRNQREELAVSTDANGNFSFQLQTPGYYLLEASLVQPGADDDPIQFYHHDLFVTLEVFPQ